MLAQAFRSNRPGVLLALLALLPALFLSGWWKMTIVPANNMPLFAVVASLCEKASWLPGVLTMLVVGICSIQLSALANDQDLLGQRSHLPALLLPLLLAVLSPNLVLEPALLGMPFVLAAMGRTWSIASSPMVLGPLFDAGVLLGLAALFHLPFAFLLVVVWASVSVIRPFQWREYVLPVVGVAVVLYLAWVVHSLFFPTDWRPLHTVLSGLPPSARAMALSAPAAWSVRFLLFLFIPVSLMAYADRYQHSVMREKNLQASFMAFFFASGVLMFIAFLMEGSYPAVLLAAPFAVFGSHALRRTKRAWLSEAAVLILLFAGLWAQWA